MAHGQYIAEIAAELWVDNPDIPVTSAEQVKDYSQIDPSTNKPKTQEQINAEKVDKINGKGLSTNDYTTAEKNKLAGISTGAEVNQNAFSTVKVGNTNIQADSKTDMLTLIAGDNVTLTPNATNDSIEISATRGGDPVDAYTKAQSDARYVQQEAGKQLSTNDYTDSDKKAVETIGDKNYAAGKDRGMGRIILAKNQSLQSQLTQTNTIYSVQYDIKVNGGSILLSPSNTMQYGGATYYYGEVVLNNGETIQASSASTKIFVQNSGYQWIDEGTSYTSSQNDLVIRLGVVAYTSNKIDFTFTGQTSATVPAGCILDFDGGSIGSGNIVCNNTILQGNVVVDKISGSIKGEFKSSYSSHTCDFEKLEMLLTLTTDKLIIDEDFTVANVLREITTSIPVIEGTGATIDVLSTSTHKGRFIRMSNTRGLSGINIDFNNNPIYVGVFISAADVLSVKDVNVSNIHASQSDNMTEGIVGIVIHNDSIDATIDIDNVNIYNFISYGDGVPATSLIGSLVGMYIENHVRTFVTISNCSLSDILNVNASGKYILDDASGIFVSNSNFNANMSELNVQNITALNAGKRVIKTSGKLVNVDGVISTNNISTSDMASSSTSMWLSVVGINNSLENDPVTVKINNLTINGQYCYGVGCTNSKVSLSNVNVNTSGNNWFSALVYSNASEVAVSNAILNDTALSGGDDSDVKFVNVYFKTDSTISSFFNGDNNTLQLYNTTIEATNPIYYNYKGSGEGNSLTMNGFTLLANFSASNPIINNKPTTKKYSDSLIMTNGTYNGQSRGIVWGNFKYVNIDNIQLIYSHATFSAFNFDLNNLSKIRVVNIQNAPVSTDLYTVIYLTNYGDQAVGIDIDGSVSKIGIDGNSESVYYENADAFPTVVSNESKLATNKYCGVTKLVNTVAYLKLKRYNNQYIITEELALANSKLQLVAALSLAVGCRAYSTTDSKPVWWDGLAWKDAAGNALS